MVPENIFWPKGEAPTGTYEVYVHHYPWNNKPTSSDYVVLISAFGFTEKFEGSISFDEWIHVADFDENGIKPVSKSTNENEIQKLKSEKKE